MSYVPATFTAGFALMLTAAGAIGGQWVSDLHQAIKERTPVKVEARSRTDRATAAPARHTARGMSNALVTIRSIDTFALPDLRMPGASAIPVLRAPTEKPARKAGSAELSAKSRPAPKKAKS